MGGYSTVVYCLIIISYKSNCTGHRVHWPVKIMYVMTDFQGHFCSMTMCYSYLHMALNETRSPMKIVYIYILYILFCTQFSHSGWLFWGKFSDFWQKVTWLHPWKQFNYLSVSRASLNVKAALLFLCPSWRYLVKEDKRFLINIFRKNTRTCTLVQQCMQTVTVAWQRHFLLLQTLVLSYKPW